MPPSATSPFPSPIRISFMSEQESPTTATVPLGEAVCSNPQTPDKRFIRPNTPLGSTISYYLKSELSEPVKIEILDITGEVIRDLEGPKEAGFHRLLWDFRKNPPQIKRVKISQACSKDTVGSLQWSARANSSCSSRPGTKSSQQNRIQTSFSRDRITCCLFPEFSGSMHSDKGDFSERIQGWRPQSPFRPFPT